MNQRPVWHGGPAVEPTLPALVMGVLNVTPDSFSDGGAWLQLESAVDHARKMVAEGAAIIDIGGESTRPGSDPVSVQEELDRVIPVVERITADLDVIVSVDTSKPEVMREAATAGAGLLNDVCGLRRDGALEAAAATGLPVCLMHMQGEPGSMQKAPQYDDVLAEVTSFLLERATAAKKAGIDSRKIILDPGFGFGKSLEHNLTLLRGLPQLAMEGFPVLAGLSRKSMLQSITGRDVSHRLAGSLALAMLAAQSGALIIRVHEVAETIDTLKVLRATWPLPAEGANIAP